MARQQFLAPEPITRSDRRRSARGLLNCLRERQPAFSHDNALLTRPAGLGAISRNPCARPSPACKQPSAVDESQACGIDMGWSSREAGQELRTGNTHIRRSCILHCSIDAVNSDMANVQGDGEACAAAAATRLAPASPEHRSPYNALMYIIVIGWLYVTALMALTESSVVAGVLTLTFYGLLPSALLLWLFGGPTRRRRRAARAAGESGANGSATDDERPDH